MKFELEVFNRNVPESELIADLKRVANELQKNSVSVSEYNERGRFHSGTLENRFGSWSKAVEIAGLSKSLTSIKKFSDEQLLDDLKSVAKQIQKSSVTRNEYEEHGQFAPANFRTRFSSWNKALDKAGLERTISFDTTDEELFTNLAEIWTRLGKQPKIADITSQTSKFAWATYARRFGSWRKALEAFVIWANKGEEQAIESPSQKEEIPKKPRVAQAQVKPPPKREVFCHRTSRTVNYRLRFLVMRKDDFKCKICGTSPATKAGTNLVVDHIKSWDAGGETVIENLQTLCEPCNIGKSNLEMSQS